MVHEEIRGTAGLLAAAASFTVDDEADAIELEQEQANLAIRRVFVSGKTRDKVRGRLYSLYRVEIGDLPGPQARQVARIGRNEPCPCGSGEKFKRCCLKGE